MTPVAQVITDPGQLPTHRRIWGRDGGVPFAQREALDWLIQCRLLGWDTSVARTVERDIEPGVSPDTRVVILACDPDRVGAEAIRALRARLEAEPLLIVARAAQEDTPLANLAGAGRAPHEGGGRELTWSGPGSTRTWRSDASLPAHKLRLAAGPEVWIRLDGEPLVAARRVGRGTVATMAAHPSEIRDVDGAATAALRHLLTLGAAAPLAWLDLEHTLVLRMDDPGGSQNVHLRSWAHRKLREPDWLALAADLETRAARLSIAYVPGWIDDGDPDRGDLHVGGRQPPRTPGAVYPSPLVTYVERQGPNAGVVHDYPSEFRGIEHLRAHGLGEVELHGYTHVHPDVDAWAVAPDRYDNVAWYRELGEAAAPTLAPRPADAHPLALGRQALCTAFDVMPTTLVCPGDEWSEPVLERALDLGFHLVSTSHLAIRHGNRFCWSAHICSPYLSEPDRWWAASGLPVIGYFHDRDPATEGTSWVGAWIDRWLDLGFRRVMDFRELAASLACRVRLEATGGSVRLVVERADGPPPVRPVTVVFRAGAGAEGSTVRVIEHGRELTLPVARTADDLARVRIPVGGPDAARAATEGRG